jgi:putative ATP-dependent endonuclease of OLD family
MKIETVTISNFRCFGPEPTTIELERGVTAFVGNNGSGKTAIFAALGKIFGVTTPQRTIQKSDFHVPADQDEVEPNAAMFIDCVLAFPELEGDDAEDPAIPDVFGHMSAAGVEESLKVRMRLQSKWLDNGTSEGVVETELRWVAALAACRT